MSELSSVSKIATYVGNLINEQDNIDTQLSPNESDVLQIEETSETIIIQGKVAGYKLIFASDAFIIDHPVQGELDSAVYKLDSGYRKPTDVYFDLTFPIYWDEGYRERIFEQEL